jgi:hypothetical protein
MLLLSLLAQSLVYDRKNNPVIHRAIRFEVVMAVREGTAVFWVVRPCSVNIGKKYTYIRVLRM